MLTHGIDGHNSNKGSKSATSLNIILIKIFKLLFIFTTSASKIITKCFGEGDDRQL